MSSPQVTRWPNGVSDATQNGIYGNWAGLRPFRYFNYIDDYEDYTAASWVQTLATSATVAVTTAPGGIRAMTTATAGAADESSIQWAGHSGAFSGQFVWDGTKDVLFYASFEVDDVVNTALFVGLGAVDTTPLSSIDANWIGFYKASGAAALVGGVSKAGTITSVALGNMVNATFVSVAMRYSATGTPEQQAGTWQVFLNDLLVGTLATASITPTVALAPTIALLNASAAAHVLSVDWMHASIQR